MAERVPATHQDLVRWAETLSGIARTGLGFTQSLYEQERFEEVLHVAGDIRAAAAVAEAEESLDVEDYVEEWMRNVGSGVAGYVTPKSGVGAIVYDEQQRILLVQRADTGIWLYPTGWADIGYSPSEVAVKEVLEETGIHCVPEKVVAVLDGMRMGFTRIPLYSTIFLCRAVGGELAGHPLETSAVGFFAEDELPPMTVGVGQWGRHAFAAIRGEDVGVLFDAPRDPPWHPHPDHQP
jgi:ADP-ribose pyrophosphatase YjhB (NUDIX family)